MTLGHSQTDVSRRQFYELQAQCGLSSSCYAPGRSAACRVPLFFSPLKASKKRIGISSQFAFGSTASPLDSAIHQHASVHLPAAARNLMSAYALPAERVEESLAQFGSRLGRMRPRDLTDGTDGRASPTPFQTETFSSALFGGRISTCSPFRFSGNPSYQLTGMLI